GIFQPQTPAKILNPTLMSLLQVIPKSASILPPALIPQSALILSPALIPMSASILSPACILPSTRTGHSNTKRPAAKICFVPAVTEVTVLTAVVLPKFARSQEAQSGLSAAASASRKSWYSAPSGKFFSTQDIPSLQAPLLRKSSSVIFIFVLL